MVDHGQIRAIDRNDSNDSAVYEMDDEIFRIHYNLDYHLGNEIIYNQPSNNLSGNKMYIIALSLTAALISISAFTQYLSQ